MKPITVVDYDPAWATQFAEFASHIYEAFRDGPRIEPEHVGSTAVAGMAAKPIIDIDLIVPSASDFLEAISRLATLGYVHQGNLGIVGREAFRQPVNSPAHNLYLCARNSAEYCRHISFRDYLRGNPAEAERYEALKRNLAARFGCDRAAYSEGKTEYVEAVLEQARGQRTDEVSVVAYDSRWPIRFIDESEYICQAVGEALVAVEHVGSTSIPGLSAKPVIDILVGVTRLAAGAQAIPALEKLGYDCRGENGIPGRLFFRKGLVQYRRTHHLHMVEVGHEQWGTMLRFRDYLRSHPEEARRYEVLKHDLAARFRDNRRAYTEGKANFVQDVLEQA